MKRLFLVAVVCTASLATGGVAASEAPPANHSGSPSWPPTSRLGRRARPATARSSTLIRPALAGRPAGRRRAQLRALDSRLRALPRRLTQKVTALVTLERGGPLTFRAAFRETFVSENTIVQIVHGRVTSGTGVYAGARGRLLGGGTATFLPDGSVVPRIVYLVTGRLAN